MHLVMEELEATQATQGKQATQPADPGPLESAPESAELVVKLLKKKGDSTSSSCVPTSFDINGELVIGRCKADVEVDDNRCSARHIRIYQQQPYGFYIEQLGRNVSFLNSQRLAKGDVRTLQHGDEISVLNPPRSVGEAPEHQPFAVFVFRLTEPDGRQRPLKRLKMAEAVEPGATVAGPGDATCDVDDISVAGTDLSTLSTEEEFQAKYDMRIDIKNLIGKGTFSEVRRGLCIGDGPGDGRLRAIKVVNRNKFNSFQMLRNSHLSMVDEAKLLTSLDHPGIVKCFEWFQTKTSLYLVMELLEGGDLLQNIMQGGCFAEGHARRLFKLICEALSYLHGKDIVHRDLKPDNVLLTSKERSTCLPKIADLGVAATYNSNLTTTCGTPHYFAPELVRGFKAPIIQEPSGPVGYGKPVDMWSLGVVLYILLSGTPPFEADGLYDQILQGRYEFDAEEWEAVSPEAKDLVRRLMTVEPEKRPTIDDALKHLWLSGTNGTNGTSATGARGTILSALGA